MKTSVIRLATAAAAVALTLTACSSGLGGSSSSGGGGSSGGKNLTLLVDNGESTVKSAQAVIDAFEKANPGTSVQMETRPQGTEGDNLVKTKLSTGDMQDVFWYKRALHPVRSTGDGRGRHRPPRAGHQHRVPGRVPAAGGQAGRLRFQLPLLRR